MDSARTSIFVLALLLLLTPVLARAHDIYSNLTNGSGRSCCDVTECRPVHYRFQGADLEMLINDHWVYVPRGMVQHRSLAGDVGETAGGHWCGEPYEGGFITYCAFVPPNVVHLQH